MRSHFEIEHMSFTEIGKALGISRTAAEFIYETAMRKITHPKNKDALFKLIESVYGCDAQKYIKAGTWRTKGKIQC